MKRIHLSFILLLSIVLSLTSCDGYESRLNGFTNALTEISEQENVRTELIIKENSTNADVLTHGDFLEAVYNSYYGLGELSDNFSYDIKLDYYYDSNFNAEVAVYLPDSESGEYKQLAELICYDKVFYLNTEIVIELLEITSELSPKLIKNMFGDAEYLKMNSDFVKNYFSGFDIGDIENYVTLYLKQLQTLNTAIKENAHLVLKEDLDILSVENGFYTVKIEEEKAVPVLEILIGLAKENTTEIINFINDFNFGKPISKDDFEIDVIHVLESSAASDYQSIVDLDLTLAVKGNANEQDLKFDLNVINKENSEATGISVYSKSKTDNKGIVIPNEDKIIDIQEFSQFFAN